MDLSKTTDIVKLLDSKSVIVVTHLKDMDGMCSAAISMHLFGERIAGVAFSDFEYDAIRDVYEILEKKSFKNGIVLFADLNFGDDALDLYKKIFEMLKSNGNAIIWLDHHKISSDAVKKTIERYADYAIAGENKEHCGAELVAEHVAKPLGLYDEKTEELAYLSHISDFALSDPKIDKKLIKASEAIASYLDNQEGIQEGLLKISKAVMNDPSRFDEDPFVNERARIYEEKQGMLKEELSKNVDSLTVRGHSILIGFNFSGSLQTNDGCSHLFKIGDATGNKPEMVIYFKVARGTGHIRVQNDSNIDSVPFAQSMKGNGHPKASAFPIPDDILDGLRSSGSKKDYAKNELISLIRKRLEEDLDPLKSTSKV